MNSVCSGRCINRVRKCCQWREIVFDVLISRKILRDPACNLWIPLTQVPIRVRAQNMSQLVPPACEEPRLECRSLHCKKRLGQCRPEVVTSQTVGNCDVASINALLSTRLSVGAIKRQADCDTHIQTISAATWHEKSNKNTFRLGEIPRIQLRVADDMVCVDLDVAET